MAKPFAAIVRFLPITALSLAEELVLALVRRASTRGWEQRRVWSFAVSVRMWCLIMLLITTPGAFAQQDAGVPNGSPLPFPGLLAKDQREAGNPLATLAAMREHEERYRTSTVFAGIYPEIRLNYEQFLGVPDAGIRAMQLPSFKANPATADASVLDAYEPHAAVDIICEQARETRLVIFGEEHHLPQTRSIYEAILRRLWDCGYRYLAAETFTERVAEDGFQGPDYHSGYYLMDPVYASAVRTAMELGYRLVSYETNERGPVDDPNFRDRTQAEHIHERIFKRDPQARVLVLAGRGHAAEHQPADGWTPMASVLKRLTGIDPLTIYAPTMSERLTKDAEHPLYRVATDRKLVSQPTIFVNKRTRTLFGFENCDAYVFWPRVQVHRGRPDWLRTTVGRIDVPVPESLLGGDGLRLVQAFEDGAAPTEIPVDQILIEPDQEVPVLVLPRGKFWMRVIDSGGNVRGSAELTH